MLRKSTKHLITRSILMLKSRDFLCKLTQSVEKIGKFFFEFEEEKNLLTASKAPLCSGVTSPVTLHSKEGFLHSDERDSVLIIKIETYGRGSLRFRVLVIETLISVLKTTQTFESQT